MEFRISPKAAKFFVAVIVLTTVSLLANVESSFFYGPQIQTNFQDRLKISSIFDSQNMGRQERDDILGINYGYRTFDPSSQSTPLTRYKSIYTSIPSTSESAVAKPPPGSLKTNINTSFPNTSEPAVPKSLPGSLKTNTRTAQVPDSERLSDSSRQVSYYLSLSTLSQADPFQYLVREMSQKQTWKLASLRIELDSRLKSNTISESVMPYARALRSIMDAEMKLQHVKHYLSTIQINRYYIQPKVSSPQALSSYEFFSPDIVADPDAPSRLINKLIEIPIGEIPNVILQLQDYVKMLENWAGSVFWDYQSYAKDLISFLKNDSILDNLKRSMAEILHISALNQNPTSDGELNGETGSSATQKV